MAQNPNPNLSLIRKVTKLWVTGKYEDIMQNVADDAEYVIARGSMERVSPLFGTFKGKAAIEKWYAENRRIDQSGGIKPFCRVEDLGKFIAVGSQVYSFGALPRTNTEPASDWVAIWTVRRNKITHCQLVMDTATAFVKMRKANPRLALA